MKKLIMYPGKYFYLMLGIFLFTSSVNLYGQEYVHELSNAINKLIESFNFTETELFLFYDQLKDPNILMKENIKPLNLEQLGKSMKKLESISRKYALTYEYYDHYIKIANRIIEKGTLEELSRLYFDPDFTGIVSKKLQNSKEFGIVSEMLPQNLVKILPKSLSNPELQYTGPSTLRNYLLCMEKTDVEKAKEAVEYMQGKINEMKEGIARIEQAKVELIRQKYTPLDIMEYAFKHMSDQERAALGLVLKARDVAVKPNEMAKSIMTYVTEYRVELNQYFPSVKDVAAELKEMTALKRVEYADEIAGLKSSKGAQKFITDYEKLDMLEKRVVRKGAQGVWGLTALAAIGTAAYIVDIAADNHFNAGYTMSNRELATIGKKIENGTANFKERFAFFRSPSSKKLVETDPVYTLSLVQLASDIYAADELLKGLKQAQEQETNDKVKQGVLKNIDKQIGTADFGVGTL